MRWGLLDVNPKEPFLFYPKIKSIKLVDYKVRVMEEKGEPAPKCGY